MSAIYQLCKPLILASASPRRQQYFDDLGLTVRVHAADIVETPLPKENPQAFVQRMAEEKARAVMELNPGSWVVAADTVVNFAGSVLGKPKDKMDAVSMLMQLSGKEHCVQTGFCLACNQENVIAVQSVTTQVVFCGFSQKTAEAYAATGEPLDKAGAYGIQGKGAFLVKEIRGSYSNIVGLPLCELLTMLDKYGVIRILTA